MPLLGEHTRRVLEARGLVVDYGGRLILDGVSFEVASGEVVGFIRRPLVSVMDDFPPCSV